MILRNGKEINLKDEESLMDEVLELFADEIKFTNGSKTTTKKALTIAYCPHMVRPNDMKNPNGARSKGGVEKPASYSVLLEGEDNDGVAWRYASKKEKTAVVGGLGEDGRGFDYAGNRKEIKEMETMFVEKDMDLIFVAYKLGYLAPSFEEITTKSLFYIMNKKKAKEQSVDKETVLAEMTIAVNKMDFAKLKNIAMAMQIEGASSVIEEVDLKIMVKGWLQNNEKAALGKPAYTSVQKIKDFMKRADETKVTNNVKNEDELSKAVAYLKDKKLISFFYMKQQIFYKKTDDGQKEVILTYTQGQDPLTVLMEYLATSPEWAEKIMNTYNLYLQEA